MYASWQIGREGDTQVAMVAGPDSAEWSETSVVVLEEQRALWDLGNQRTQTEFDTRLSMGLGRNQSLLHNQVVRTS